jgi:hypothetical protein
MTNERIIPETLYIFPCEARNAERKNVIKDFCFPNGLSM